MKKTLFVLLSVLVLTSMLLSACGTAATATKAPATQAPATKAPAGKTVKKIAFFVSDLSNVFHQAQAAEAVKYAKTKYGVDVTVFDGKADSATMTANIDQIVAQGMDAATLHIWDADAAKPGVEAALAKGIIMTSFFSPLSDTGIPTARNDEKGVSFAMGVEMANQWKAAFPNKPIVMVEEGWPTNTEVKSGRTDPWVQGVLSVDSTAKDLGCLDVSKGADQAKQVTTDLVTQHPDVNLIYAEAGDQAEAAMVALQQAGRGKFDNGKPLTEIVAGVDFDATQLKQIYDPNSSLKLSLGLPPIETADGRIDLIMDIASGKTAQVSHPEQQFFYKANNMSFWTMPRADAVTWMNTEFGTNLK
jgi:ABC-type sugar transport system substrate-binding protein